MSFFFFFPVVYDNQISCICIFGCCCCFSFDIKSSDWEDRTVRDSSVLPNTSLEKDQEGVETVCVSISLL